MQIHIKSKYMNDDVILDMTRNYGNGSRAITATSLQGEPLFTATVAIDELPADGRVFLKGWSENEGIPEALVKAGIVELTGRTVPTGYCEAIEAKLNV